MESLVAKFRKELETRGEYVEMFPLSIERAKSTAPLTTGINLATSNYREPNI